jgi:hypothetical protein
LNLIQQDLMIIMIIERNWEEEGEMVNSMGDFRFMQKDFMGAIRLYRQSVSLMKKAGNQDRLENFQKELEAALSGRARDVNNEGDALFADRKYKQAIDVYQEAWDILEEAGEPYITKMGREFTTELINAKVFYATDELGAAAEKHVLSKNWEAAIESYEKISAFVPPELNKEANDKIVHSMKTVYERWGQEVNDIGDELYKQGKFDEAITIYADSVRLIELTDNEKKKKEFKKELTMSFNKHAQNINNIGDRLVKEKSYKKASNFYAQSVKIAKEGGNQKLIANFEKELKDSLAKYAQQINDQGDKLLEESEFEEAAKVYLESVIIAESAAAPKLIQEFRREYNISLEKWAEEMSLEGELAMKQRDLEEAEKYFKLSLKIIKRTENQVIIDVYEKELHNVYREMAILVKGYGDQTFEMKRYQQAYDYYDFCITMAEKSSDEALANDYMRYRNKAYELISKEN